MVSSHQQQHHHQQAPPKIRRTGGRKPREQETQLPPEEEEKRRLRRIRNKEAAARCRKRRVDHMNALELEVNKLADQYKLMEDELTRLTQEREQLQFILTTHEPVCQFKNDVKLRLNAGEALASLAFVGKATEIIVQDNKIGNNNNNNKKPAAISLVVGNNNDPTLSCVNPATMISEVIDLQTHQQQHHHHSQSTTASSVAMTSSSSTPLSRDLLLCRPNTLSLGLTGSNPTFTNALSTNETPLSINGGSGIPIQTPSKIIDYDPMNGPTGATPITQASFLAQFLCPSNLTSLETPVTDVKPGVNSFTKL